MTRKHLKLVVSNSDSSASSGPGRRQASFQRALDPYLVRCDLPERWRAYVRECFASYNDAAAFFDVTGQCAINWREGVHRPSADKLLLVAILDPDGFDTYFRQPYQKAVA